MKRQEILYLFDRPAEPICIPKGKGSVRFKIPPSYLPETYQSIAEVILNRVGEESSIEIPVKPIRIPNLKPVLTIGRREPFSLFVQKHQKAAGHLINLFLGMRSYDDLLSLAVYCRDRVNTQMFIYALSVAMLHRNDTKHLQIPNLLENFPGKFVDRATFSIAIEEANVVPVEARRPTVIPLNFTATDRDPEHRVAYWREDVGLNLHHWHWHLVYPMNGPESVVRKDRRGELFYYMHHQMIARYNIERLCNKLARVKRLNELRDPVPEAYFPKLDPLVASRVWPGRPAMSFLQDVNRSADDTKRDIADLDRSRDRIMEVIHQKTIRLPNGSTMPLTEETGIDVLGNIVEASSVAPNAPFYGNLHNDGHSLIAFCHDPDNRYLESFGVMGDTSTAMRDPIFYRWHAYIDDIFIQYKNSLPAYTAKQLEFPGIIISECSVTTQGVAPNVLVTHWTQNDIELANGLDFAPRGPILARATHLNNREFSYNIQVQNANAQMKQGTVRIFMAPVFDEAELQFNFAEQRNLMIEMDKFTVDLRPGVTTIERRSVDSAMTTSLENTFRIAETDRPSATDVQSVNEFNWCGCGWPQYLLVPRGRKEGYEVELFVMITDYELDKVDQPGPEGCRTGIVFCGLRDRKYPDARPMGFPFDRLARANVTTMSQFLTPNMRTTKVSIQFTDTVIPNKAISIPAGLRS